MAAYERAEDRARDALSDGQSLTVDEIFGETDDAQRKRYARVLGELVLSGEVTKRGGRYRLRSSTGGRPQNDPRPERSLAPWSNGLPDRKVTLPHGLAALMDQCPPPGDVWPEKVKVLLAIAAQFDALWPDEEG